MRRAARQTSAPSTNKQGEAIPPDHAVRSRALAPAARGFDRPAAARAGLRGGKKGRKGTLRMAHCAFKLSFGLRGSHFWQKNITLTHAPSRGFHPSKSQWARVIRGRLPAIGRPNAEILNHGPPPAYARGQAAVGGAEPWPRVQPSVLRGLRAAAGL